MKEIVFTSKLKVFDHLDQLNASDAKLLRRAIAQMEHAYAPYSNFSVGAAVLLKNGKILGGANQENASYPLCMCGERVALYHAAMQFPNEIIKTLAIVASNQSKSLNTPVSPCGACRQVIFEYEEKQGTDIRILLTCDSHMVYELESAKALLPFAFEKSVL